MTQRQIFFAPMTDGRFALTIAYEEKTESVTVIMSRGEAETFSAGLLKGLQVQDPALTRGRR